MRSKKKRIFGKRIDFKSLSCEPLNELGVVYLFGVLHDALGFKIESIQSGFPDCIARRQISDDQWEELRIEFEYKSKTFLQHKHDPKKVDIIICWKHDWKDCPEYIEVIELKSTIKVLEEITGPHKETKALTTWKEFARRMRLNGYSFDDIAKLWELRRGKGKKKKIETELPLSEWQKFCREKRLEGKTFSEIGQLWRKMKKKQE